jgi:hypothetical protein
MSQAVLNPVQFFHGSVDDFETGQKLTVEGAHAAGAGDEHVFFTSDAGHAATVAGYRAFSSGKEPKVYQVHPEGEYEGDDLDGPGSYRTKAPLRIGRRVQ